MALKQLAPISVYVGGIKYMIRPFPAFKAANISGELANLLLPLFGAVIGMVDTEKPDDKGENKEGNDKNDGFSLDDIDVGTAVEAITKCVNINGVDIESMMRKLLLGGHIVVCDIPDDSGNIVQAQVLTEDAVNEIFCANLQNMYKLCYEVIKVNFNGFFEKLAVQSGKPKSVETTMHMTL